MSDSGGLKEPTADAIFLQLILAAGYISKQDLNDRVDHLNKRLPEPSRRNFYQIEAEAHTVLGAIGMDFVQVRDDFDEGEIYFLVITREHLPLFLNKLAIPPSHALQLKEILKLMFRDSRCEGIEADDLPTSKIPAKHTIIERLIKENRFLYLDRTHLFISTRLLYEMEEYLKEEFGGKTLLKCAGCQSWLLKGRLCENEFCDFRLHDRCYDSYFSSKSLASDMCPKCSSQMGYTIRGGAH